MKKVFSILDVKSAENTGNKRIFKGIASTPNPDLVDDVVEPKGAEYQLPLPLLWQHNHANPIGWITKAKILNSGIEVEGEIAEINEPGNLKNRIDEAWQMIKNKLVRGLSIAFKTIDAEDIPGSRGGQRIKKWKWLELSAVTIPANMDANISTIKAAFGYKNISGVSEQQKRNFSMKTLNEQLAELKELRTNKTARMQEISELIQSKSETNEDNVEFDSLADELSQIDNDIRVKTAEIFNANTATPVKTVRTSPNIIVKSEDKEETFKGQNFTRMVIAKALAKMDDVSPVAIAQQRWGKSNPKVVGIIKAAVEGGGAGSGEWGAELVAADTRYTGDFIEYLKENTVFDRLPLKSIPSNVQVKGRDGAATGYWVGESAAIPVSAQSFSAVNLSPLKVAALAVVSNELLRDSTPAAEQLVRDALIEASAQRIDATFFGTGAAVSGVSPAGILNGLVAGSASGTDADSLRADIKTLIAAFITAKNAGGLYICMNPALALSIQMLYNALGQPEFPDINQNGGRLLGMEVFTGDNIATDDLIILKPSDIYKIGDSGLQISISREAMIEMDSAPAMESQGPTTASGAVVGMFQTESTAIKVVRPINFQTRRTASSCVGYIGDAAYDNSSS